MRRTKALGSIVAVGLLVAATACSGEDASSGDTATASTAAGGAPAAWTTFGFDLANSRFNATETTVTHDSVATLGEVWEVEGLNGMSATPAVVDGVVYFGDWDGVARAVDAETGEERWSTELDGGPIMSSVTIDGDAAYVTTSQTLYRLDRASGDVVWEAVSSDHGLAISPASPVVAEGLVLQGTASGELMVPVEDYSFRGSVAAFDAETGEERWRTWFTTGDATAGNGVGVWSTPSVDLERGLAFVGTGNTYEPPASTLSDSIIALRLDTGEVAWSRQFTYPDVWSTGHSDAGGVDGDVGAGPNLWSADGRDLVGAGDKVGVYHALDRDTGEVVWETEMTEGSVLGGVIGTSAHGDGRIFVGSNVGTEEGNMPTGTAQVLALDDGSGEVLWRADVSGAIYASIAAVPGVVLVGTTEGTMHAFDAVTGDELWTHTAPDQVGSGPSVVDGTVYWGYGFALSLGSTSKGLGGLYALRPGAGDAGEGDDAQVEPTGVGAEVYRMSCASCHGPRGQGGVGPSLVGIAERRTLEEHLKIVREGSPGTQMPGFAGDLTDEEIEAVVEHERTAFAG